MIGENISTEIEAFTKEAIFADLSSIPSPWLTSHTSAVVHYVKEIVKEMHNLEVDMTVLVISAYAHDWGYVSFYGPDKILSYEEYMDAKIHHADVGAKNVQQLLENKIYDCIAKKRKSKIVSLVKNHEKDKDEDNTEGKILTEADLLGALDTNICKPTFDYDANVNYLNSVSEKAAYLIGTEYSKNMFMKLVERRRHYYENCM